MKTKRRRLFSLFLIMLMTAAMTGQAASVSFAADSLVVDCCGDMWITAGGRAYAWVETSEPVTGVELQKQESGSWVKYGDCKYDPNHVSTYWGCYIQPSSLEEGQSWNFRFAFRKGSGTGFAGYSPVFKVECTNVFDSDRIAGRNRFQTALEASYRVADLTGGEYRNAIIACGTDFADALGGTYLSAKYDAPIFLVNNTSAVMNEIAGKVGDRLASGGKVFILGGYGAVSEYMEIALQENGVTEDQIERFRGANRYDTNIRILEYCGVSTEEILVCCATEFADALSASALGRPVVLVGKALTNDQKDYLNSLSPDTVYLVGGIGAVPQAVEDWFETNGFSTHRYAGKNRYDTSAKLAKDFFSRNGNHQSYYVLLAYSLDFPDGLSAGPLAYKLGAPLLLVNNSNYLDAERFIEGNECRVALAMGGPALISDATLKRIIYLTDLHPSSVSGE